MLASVIQFSIKNRLAVLLGTLAVIIWGAYAITTIPIDAVPDITNNQVQIITTSPSLAAQEVERFITFPVEQTMATIPGIVEVRSMSRFGLSVVTIVLKDNVDIYWARQQINERLQQAKSSIPGDLGNPEMAPVTTGLGEIYQYTLRLKKGFEGEYSLSRLRTIQDWIIRRQLLGTPGIADVSNFGGYLKEYEIAVSTDKLNSMKLSMGDVFTALERNNQNTGGAYIEKGSGAYFIRSEGLVGSIPDIENIVVRNENGIPVYVRDIGKVQEGHAVRYGAMTFNNKGETVGGIVMMLKGANSNEVITRVKAKMAEIQKTLPQGIVIEPYLDRTQLVNRAIHTVEKNLIEGALIVIFVLVIFLGNLRAGLLVSSVIPLSMLFALGMMQVFGVSGNLMSLGAIDFGLIVDGAVIIVEAVMHLLHDKLKQAGGDSITLQKDEMRGTVFTASSRMVSAAIFGQIIILIVYLPILSLSGIEGKMFRPMAETVSFAIVGALIFSVTYVPMMSAWVLSPKVKNKKSFADKMMEQIEAWYGKALQKALDLKVPIIGFAIAALVTVVIIFMNMGGEFLPTLEEGDFAVETRLVTGTSLSQTIETAQKAAEILKKEFPEVKKVVGKIGTSEIPTDPMPFEACDLIIVLKEKKEWTSAKNWQELAGKMSDALKVLPQASFGFQQPIQMRFNELIAGARQDVVVKIFGDDLERLKALADQTGRVVSGIKGAKDVYIEQVTGLPQIVVRYNRDAIARYGLSIADVNKTLEAGFAGSRAGTVYEGEERYDMVVRLDTSGRHSIEDVQNLYVANAAGLQIPINQLAEVKTELGPNQIQRENARRRIVVGFNVRGRDVESIVEELEKKMSAEIKLPAGYNVKYGGQFQNLIEAKSRLSIAVPVALLLILLLLYAAFASVKEALLIFSAIPFAAVGGVFALLLRGMPFSISAGIGFIALFGVAVLNGIVLISEFNRLKKLQMTDVAERVLTGAKSRIRPVLMTASVASLGFLPMALSNTAGAEVQKPLATVVIGGLITSTLLTLFLLPILYTVAEHRIKPKTGGAFVVLLFVLFGISNTSKAQTFQKWTLSNCIDTALKNNKQIATNQYEVKASTALQSSAWDPGKTNVAGMFGQYNSFEKGDNHFSVTQNIPFPTQMVAQKKLYESETHSANARLQLTKYDLSFAVANAYQELVYLQSLHRWYIRQDSIYINMLKAATKRVKVGEAPPIEQTLAQSKYEMMKARQSGYEAMLRQSILRLQMLLQTEALVMPVEDSLVALNEIDTFSNSSHPFAMLNAAKMQIAKRQMNLEQQKMMPDFSVGYFNQSLIGNPMSSNGDLATAGNRFQGVQVGVNVPLIFGAQSARIKSARWGYESAKSAEGQAMTELQQNRKIAFEELERQKTMLDYYSRSALPEAEKLLIQGQKTYMAGEVDYTTYLQSIETASGIKADYLQTLLNYNKAVLGAAYYNAGAIPGVNK
ncbi:CusA/CzcA family heavy metal efflux RND transporter [Taibaiella soli]|uniref:CusA/CzcA family heavy metal efflux RND transporter n=1 Tax=Taibaiella soli TaxID=1649169 RepID=A0A2W2AYB0_9BACT|nr:CusA/CzcA family heavy metal efflux RND transporter [Taibaiella soli]PZF73034.1 CusA/CzcA family heavy metal efflux RND transporter [Taibaiella soli]